MRTKVPPAAPTGVLPRLSARVPLSAHKKAPFIFIGIAVALVVARYLPSTGIGLLLKLALIGHAVLLLPGALALWAFRWKADAPLFVAASLGWSLIAVFIALALTFVVNGSIWFTAALLGIFSIGAFLIGWVRQRRAVPREAADSAKPVDGSWNRTQVLIALGVGGAAVLFGVSLWVAPPLDAGDTLEHLARARKLAEFDSLQSLASVDQYRGVGLDPGYAFPLWHAVLAVIARVSRADVADVVQYLPSVLSAMSFLLLYGAGSLLFRSWVGGAVMVIAEVGRLGFAFAAGDKMTLTGWFAYLSRPGQAAILLLAPALLALVFAFTRSASRALLLSIATVAFAIAVIHPSYAIFIAIPLVGFLAARFWLSPGEKDVRKRLALALAAILVPSALFFVWLLPVLRTATFFQPGVSDWDRVVGVYRNQLSLYGESWVSIAPSFLASGGGGAVTAAALLAIPAAVLSAKRRWGAYVLGGSLIILAIVLIPPVFTTFSQFAGLSQARRLAAFFLPWAAALTGAVLLVSRFKWVAVGLSLIAGAVFLRLFPAHWVTAAPQTAPTFPVWLAVAGGIAALVAGRFLPRGDERVHPVWAIAIAIAFVAPLAVWSLSHLERDSRPDLEDRELTPGIIAAVRQHVGQREVVLSTLQASYRIQAYSPVYVAAVTEGHARTTTLNRHFERVNDVRFFFRRQANNLQREQTLSQYGVRWIIVDKTRPYPRDFFGRLRRVYEDHRYALYLWGT